MKIAPFATEHFFAQYEFSAPYQLCNSDCETVTVEELLTLADTTMAQFGRLSLGYTESLGHPALREQIAASYSTIDPDHVIMLGTPIEGIYLTARAVLDPGDEVIVMAPAYDALNNMFAHVVGAENVCTWPVEPTDRGWNLEMDRLRALITPKTKMVVVNFPHNPTGYLPTQDQLAEIIRVVEEKDLILFCDEMYFGLVLGDTPAITSAAELSQRTIVLSGLSKTYGLPGLRTGWLIVQDESLRQNIVNWKFYTSICAPAPSEFLALAAWRVRHQLRDKNIAQIEQNLHVAEAFFRRWPDLFSWRRPQAGSVALVGMNVPSVMAYATKLVAEAGVLLPAVTLGGTDAQMRMGFGRAAFPQALEKFEAYLRSG